MSEPNHPDIAASLRRIHSVITRGLCVAVMNSGSFGRTEPLLSGDSIV